jgi:hypothetical protein
MSPIRFVVAAFGIAGAALTAVSLAFTEENWYKITLTTTNMTATTTYGVIKQCANDGCTYTQANDLTLGSCTRPGTLISARIYACLACTIVGGFLCLLAVPASIPNVKGAAVGRVVLMAFAFALLAVAVGLFYVTFEQWLFCDKNFCALYPNTTCDATFTLYYWLLVAAAGSALVGMLVGVVSVITTPPTVEVEPTQPTSTDAKDGSRGVPVEAAEEVGGGEVGEEEAAEGDEDQGDWAYDDESGMYWSESSCLYLHWESGMFYDPNSGYWYDPESDQWFAAEEEEGGAAE